MTIFKKSLTTLGVCTALAIAAQANAANDVTLKVSGNVTPSACTPTLTNSGEVSFGTISASSIRSTASGNSLVQLGAKDITLNVTCDAATAIGFKMTDNRASSAVTLSSSSYIDNPFVDGEKFTESYFSFGLGNATNGKKIGVYSLVADVKNATVGGATAGVIFTEDSGASWRIANTWINQRPEAARILSVSKAGTTAPVMFTEMSMPLKIAAGIQTSSVLGFDEIVLDGNATLSLVYL